MIEFLSKTYIGLENILNFPYIFNVHFTEAHHSTYYQKKKKPLTCILLVDVNILMTAFMLCRNVRPVMADP